MKKEKNIAILLLLGGFVSGFINGLLGAGGGIIIVYLLSHLARKQKVSSSNGSFSVLTQHDILANALCIMFPVSIVSFIIYFLRGNVIGSQISFFIIPAVLGGIAGGIALPHIRSKFLKKTFSLLVIISGMILAIKG